MRAFLIASLLVLSSCVAGPGGPLPRASGAAVWPLRGTTADAAAAGRRPIVVRVDDAIDARPQAGFTAADMVWEFLVEGGVTRYAVVYHSQDAAKVGPVRSARLSDLWFAPMVRGILAHVGAQATVLERIRDGAKGGAFVDLDQLTHEDAYERVGTRRAPFNVYTSTQRLRQATGDRGTVEVPALAFKSDVPAAGAEAAKFVVPYQGVGRVGYQYDPSASAYRRTQGDKRTVDDATSQDVDIANVVVIRTDIREVPGLVEDEFGSLSLEIRSTGEGAASVFRDGKRIDGKWSRSGNDMFRFVDASGAVIPLRPGLTWVHVVPTDWQIE
ncbi:MAG TPA: DUF3048 domain-containing protein [Candidatus Dormibacteraeota bacterium]|nr:DUF3048 domain-containing protein [Candidatus Dormibacteraeota bacterium]